MYVDVASSYLRDQSVTTMLIENCLVSKILVNGGSFINILYRGTLNRMEDTSETTWAMISSQTQFHLYGFDGNETHPLDIILLPVRANPYNVITEFYMVDMEFPHNAILRRPWFHMMRAVLSTYNQLVQYLTLIGTINIRGDQAATKIISTAA